MNVRTPVVAEWVKADSGKRLVMDVRDPSDFADGHIPTAKNIRLQDVAVDQDARQFVSYKTIVVYGRDPNSARARAMTKLLMNTGYKDVVLLEDGCAGWLSDGGAVSRGR